MSVRVRGGPSIGLYFMYIQYKVRTPLCADAERSRSTFGVISK